MEIFTCPKRSSQIPIVLFFCPWRNGDIIKKHRSEVGICKVSVPTTPCRRNAFHRLLQTVSSPTHVVYHVGSGLLIHWTFGLILLLFLSQGWAPMSHHHAFFKGKIPRRLRKVWQSSKISVYILWFIFFVSRKPVKSSLYKRPEKNRNV